MIIKTDVPDYLYHYTSVDTLEKILMNRTIRFSSLINVDDKEEILTSSGSNFGKDCFVSSWTDIEDESIPFWAEYTENMCGVRIKLHTLPFNKNIVVNKYYYGGEPFETYYPLELFDKEKIFCYCVMPFCRKVQYTSDCMKIKIQDITHAEYVGDGHYENIQANFMEIGKYKRKCWEFQSEWRYCMFFIPADLKSGEINFDASSDKINLDFSYYDLCIAEKDFAEMEIVTGPRMDEQEKIRVIEMVKKYCPTAKVIESSLQIRR